ncbi:hypothetical protein SDC9_118983 [bioreactor metagenome]|uniref:Spermidine synthase n=1 Tax=bioreactor metagenome TaxID=1076179 RepID=A0A645C2L5_9ZZZZ
MFLKSPYHQQVDLQLIKDPQFRYTRETIRAHELFNIDAIQPDYHRELNDWMKLRALDQSYETIVLWQKHKVWMIDAPSEAKTIDPYAAKAAGDVLTFGLGIGYFIFMAMRNPQVKSLTVIENSSEVIALFQKYLLPQFAGNTPLKIVCGDAYDYFNSEYMKRFDYVFVDIWQSNQDGLTCIERMLESYNPPIEQVDFWIEDSCLEIMPALIFGYFYQLIHPSKRLFKFHRRIQKMIKEYFDQDNMLISQVGQLKELMYSRTIQRRILALPHK